MKLSNAVFYPSSYLLQGMVGGTATGTIELGQSKPIYPMDAEDCSTLLNGMLYNIVSKELLDYRMQETKEVYIVSVFNDIDLKIFDVTTKATTEHLSTYPLVMFLVKDDSAHHTSSLSARKQIKLNKTIKTIDGLNNNDFYDQVTQLVGANIPWFVSELNYNIDVNRLELIIIKCPQSDNPYNSEAIRKNRWETYREAYYDKSIDISPNQSEYYGQNVIFFGAPGTGKSHTIKQLLNSRPKIRIGKTTFHPEYDYHSFVGGYKPTSDNQRNITYEFCPEVFTDMYTQAWSDSSNEYFLVIEEINRGNCAEIFGDIFQLLDRDGYDNTASRELRAYLTEKFGENHPCIANGLIKLPSNLTILATMNTSDQSLYPMDSAFKRRWDWEYIPICYEAKTEDGKENKSSKFEVVLEVGRTFSWIKFIEKVNTIIKSEPSLGMDKCIGNYFVQPKDKQSNTIELKDFIHKVIFYLWNDVFKDEANSVFEANESYEDFFPIEKGKERVEAMLKRLEL